MEALAEPNTQHLDTLFAIARRHDSALVIALAVRDPIAIQMAAGRLDLTLSRASAALDALSRGAPSRGAELLTIFLESTRGMYERLQLAVSYAQIRDPRRMTQWLLTPGRSESVTSGPDLFELDAKGVALPAATFLGLHVARCWLITDLHDSTLIDTFVEHTDFTYADLRNTLWQQTRAHQSFFREASFADATFDSATFVDCDLRRADFSMADRHGLATTTRVDFLRCDLRGTNWAGRDLCHVRAVDCKLDGIVDRAEATQRTRGCSDAALRRRRRLPMLSLACPRRERRVGNA